MAVARKYKIRILERKMKVAIFVVIVVNVILLATNEIRSSVNYAHE
jgi:hypothetical protein